MKRKYIIELEDKNVWTHGYPDRTLAFDMKIFGTELTPINTGIPLTPYTEPDMEQVKEDAFKNGYDAACKDIDIKSKTNAAYRKGLEDAWEAARKIQDTGGNLSWWIHNTTASEAIEKIRQYEQEKEEQIQVGDEVKNTQTDARFIVTHMWVNNHGEKGVSGFNHECSAFSTALDLVRKTGRRFPEIAEALQKMKEA